jgi:hypothetical protein
MITFWTVILILTSGEVVGFELKKPMSGSECLSFVSKEFGDVKEIGAYGCIRKSGKEV